MAARVLICDDSFGFPALVRSWLGADDGFVVGIAHGGDELRRAARDERPDVVVLDLLIPGVTDTAGLVRELRELAPGVRVVLVSSLTEPELARAADAADADGWCTKGMTGGSLVAEVQRVLGAAGSETEKTAP